VRGDPVKPDPAGQARALNRTPPDLTIPLQGQPGQVAAPATRPIDIHRHRPPASPNTFRAHYSRSVTPLQGNDSSPVPHRLSPPPRNIIMKPEATLADLHRSPDGTVDNSALAEAHRAPEAFVRAFPDDRDVVLTWASIRSRACTSYKCSSGRVHASLAGRQPGQFLRVFHTPGARQPDHGNCHRQQLGRITQARVPETIDWQIVDPFRLDGTFRLLDEVATEIINVALPS
jgi:hypothetical protein